MGKSDSLILNNDSVNKKLLRITHQINEGYHREKEIYLVGIRENGYSLAKIIASNLSSIKVPFTIKLIELIIDKKKPLSSTTQISPDKSLTDKNIILIDDVLNSGRTLMHAASYIMNHNIKKMNTIVLVDRRHRSFPIKADWVGLTLSTTIQENIRVEFNKKEINVYLE